MSFSSSVQTVGRGPEPDIIYYNASIVNNTTNDVGTSGVAVYDPPIRFNETRDTAILRDSSKYQFSIVRFNIDGGNLDLPLFIPSIQSSTGQTDVNLTVYGVGICYSGIDGNYVSYGNNENDATTPGLNYVEYEPETLNTVLAPLPRTTANSNFVGVWVSGDSYSPGQIVYVNATSSYYQCLLATSSQDPTVPVSPAVWQQVSSTLGNPQDITSRYYWVYTYEHWVNLVQTALEGANVNCYQAWSDRPNPPAWSPTSNYTKDDYVSFSGSNYIALQPSLNEQPDTATTFWSLYVNPYATYDDWLVSNPTPILSFDPTSQLFSIQYPPSYLSLADQAILGNTQTVTKPVMSLYFNTNLFGLYAGFPNFYYNTRSPFYSDFTAASLVSPRWDYEPRNTPFPDGFANNLDVRLIANGANIVSSTVGSKGDFVNMTQNYTSVSTLWSPVEAIVFTSSLLPIQNEQTAPPNALGTQNVGNSSATSASAFSPIITDIALDLGSDGAGYRKMIYYAPTAEYRMADFQNSKTDIRTIDIQVFWRSRLDNQLYPISMFNLSSVGIKIMFRRKGVGSY